MTEIILMTNLTDHKKPLYYKGTRKLEVISGIVLHQCACKIETAQRWKKVNAHYGISSDGVVYRLSELTDYITHAQGLSLRTVGIEVSGNWYGIEGDPKTLWTPGGAAARMTVAIEDSIRRAIKDVFVRLGRTVPIYAHRQSSDRRLWCPGEAIYRIGHVVNISNGFEEAHTLVVGAGKPIPAEWMEV